MRHDVFIDTTLAAGGSVTSGAIDLRGKRGYFTLLLKTTGSGVVDVTYTCSDREDSDYVSPSSGATLISSHSAGGTAYSIDIVTSEFVKFKVTENGTGGVTIDKLVLMMR